MGRVLLNAHANLVFRRRPSFGTGITTWSWGARLNNRGRMKLRWRPMTPSEGDGVPADLGMTGTCQSVLRSGCMLCCAVWPRTDVCVGVCWCSDVVEGAKYTIRLLLGAEVTRV